MDKGKGSSEERNYVIRRSLVNHKKDNQKEKTASAKAFSTDSNRHRKKRKSVNHSLLIDDTNKWKVQMGKGRKRNDNTKRTKKAKIGDQENKEDVYFSESKAEGLKQERSLGKVSEKNNLKKDKLVNMKAREHSNKIKFEKRKNVGDSSLKEANKWKTRKRKGRRGNYYRKRANKARNNYQENTEEKYYPGAKLEGMKQESLPGKISKKNLTDEKEKSRNRKTNKQSKIKKTDKNKMSQTYTITEKRRKEKNRKFQMHLDQGRMGSNRINKLMRAKGKKGVKQSQRQLEHNGREEARIKNNNECIGVDQSPDIEKEKKKKAEGRDINEKDKKVNYRKCPSKMKKCVKVGGKCRQWGKCKTKVISGKCGKSKTCACCIKKTKKSEYKHGYILLE